MAEIENRKRPRRGTHSCLECRLAKVRCIRLNDEAKLCRRCEERGWGCTTQVVSQSRPRRDLSARSRLNKLESKLANLSQEVHHLESKSKPPLPSSESLKLDKIVEDEEQGEDCSLQGVFADVPASHLQALFQNNLLSIQNTKEKHGQEVKRSKVSSRLHEHAKNALRRLIPSKPEVRYMARYSSNWLSLLHDILPQPFMVKTQAEVFENFERMVHPDVDVISLASWLLALAITAEQMSQECDNGARWMSLSQAISICVENDILAHDKLIGTVEGLGVGMLFLRLQISRGNFLKVWICLRRFMAIAELMGLPKAYQVADLYDTSCEDLEESQIHKARLWEMMCAAERLCAIFLDLSPSVQSCAQPRAYKLMKDGVIQTPEYFRKLTHIAANFQKINPPLGNESYCATLEIDKTLKALVSEVPRTWWDEDSEVVESDRIVQFLHCFIVARVHLTFALRRDSEEQYFYSRVVCRDACEAVAKRYLSIRQSLPTGIFAGQVLDLQVFTAVIVLLLTSYDQSRTGHFGSHRDSNNVGKLVKDVTRLMQEKSTSCKGFDYARSGVHTIESLSMLLQQDQGAAEMTLKIPIIGTLHVRRGGFPPDSPQTQRQAINPGLHHTEDPRQTLAPTLELTNSNAQGDWSIDWSIQHDFENFLLHGAGILDSPGHEFLWPEVPTQNRSSSL